MVSGSDDLGIHLVKDSFNDHSSHGRIQIRQAVVGFSRESPAHDEVILDLGFFSVSSPLGFAVTVGSAVSERSVFVVFLRL